MEWLNSVITLSNYLCHLKSMLTWNPFQEGSIWLKKIVILLILKNTKSIFLEVFLVLMMNLGNQLFFVNEKMQTIFKFMLSKYFNDIVDQDGIKNDGVNELIPNLDSKIKHVFHCRNLQLYLLLRLELIVVQRNLRLILWIWDGWYLLRFLWRHVFAWF